MSARARSRRPGLKLVGSIAAAVCLAGLIRPERLDAQGAPQVKVGGLITIPVFDERERVIARLRGMRPDLLPNNRYQLESVRLDYYDGEGGTNLIVFGTNCVYDAEAETATSTNWLHILTGDRRLSLRGRGFTWSQATSDLIISNEVRTTIFKKPVSDTAPTNRPIFIGADRVRLLSRSNLISYIGHVKVDDEDMTMSSSILDIVQGAQGGVQRITAGGGVEIISRRDGSRTTSETADYDGERGVVRLTGRPRWEDGVREGTADLFVLERRENQVRAIGNARMKLPRVAPGEGGELSGDAEDIQPGSPAADPEAFLEVQAFVLTFQLPETNGPIERVTAETNVVVIDRLDRSRAEARKAVYDGSGSIRLTGRPVWKGEDNRLLRAELLALDVVAQTFVATTNVFLKLPIRSLTPSTGAESEVSDTTRVLDVWCDWLDYRSGWLHFGDRVHLEYVDDDRVRGRMDCPTVSLEYSNRVERIVAQGGVEVEEFPFVRPSGETIGRTLTCESLDATFGPDGALRRLRAMGEIVAVQTEWIKEQPLPLTKRAAGDAAVASFIGKSNQVDRVEAEGNILFSQGDRTVRSDRAVFTGADDLLRLTGDPVATFPEGEVTQADALVWNYRTGTYRIEGRFRSWWKQTPLTAGLTNLMPELKLSPPD